jgi:pimeloyl-ACP methyl ester carboxylesterase
MDLREALPRIKAPTLVIGAEQDQSTRRKSRARSLNAFPGRSL